MERCESLRASSASDPVSIGMTAWGKGGNRVSPIQDQSDAAVGTALEDRLVAMEGCDRAEHADGGCAGAGLCGGRESVQVGG